MKELNIERYNIGKLAIFFFVLSVFTKEIGNIKIGGFDYDFIGNTFFIIYFISRLIKKNLIYHKYNILVLFIILIANVYSYAFNNLDLAGFFKQFIPIAIIYLASYDILKRTNFEDIFRLYVLFAFYSAIIGIIQFILMLGGISFLTNFVEPRIDSVAFEPSHYVAILSPAVIYSILFFKEYKLKCIIMCSALLLTFSLTGYVILGSILLIAYNKVVYLFFLTPVLYLVYSNYIITNSDYFFRIQGVLDYFKSGDFYDIHGTPLSFASNLEVAKESLSRNFLFGSGLGGHEKLYFETLDQSNFSYNYLYGLNSKSAHSLTIRILSETGIVGFFFYLYVLFRNFFLTLSKQERAICLGCLSHFMSKTLKLGGYFDYGTSFFLMILIIIYVQHKRIKRV